MHSATLELRDGNVCYRVHGSASWELPASAIRIIGEATNQNGPCLADYFLCFAAEADCWYEASFYAEGRDQFLKSLRGFLGCELQLRLAGSTDFDSSVLWPAHLAGRPMFSFKPVPPTTWIGRWIGRLAGPMRNTQVFSDEVLGELWSESRTDRCT